MLKEHKHVIQKPGEDRKRWFTDRKLDLILWENASQQITAFQLCYDVAEKQKKIVTWNGGAEIKHSLIDDSQSGTDGIPAVSAAGPVNYRRLLPEFDQHSRNLEPRITGFILDKFLNQKDCTLKRSDFVGHAALDKKTVIPGTLVKDKKSRVLLTKKTRGFFFSDENPPPRRTMLPEELLKKVKKIELTTRRIVTDMMGGQYRSLFKGHGVQFSEHRVYVAGDDIRHIDWKVSARTREPLVKKYEEERELTVLLVVDVSSSEYFSSKGKLKNEICAELGGMLAYAANQTGDRVGALLFADQVEKLIVPKKGKSHVLRIIRDLLSFEPATSGTNLERALESARRVLKHSGVVFVISDFIDEGYENALRRLGKEHDVVAIWIQDPREKELPTTGSMVFVDPESGQRNLVELGSYGFKKWFNDFNRSYQGQTQRNLVSAQVQILKVSTQEDYGEALVRFFKTRSRRRV